MAGRSRPLAVVVDRICGLVDAVRAAAGGGLSTTGRLWGACFYTKRL